MHTINLGDALFHQPVCKLEHLPIDQCRGLSSGGEATTRWTAAKFRDLGQDRRGQERVEAVGQLKILPYFNARQLVACTPRGMYRCSE